MFWQLFGIHARLLIRRVVCARYEHHWIFESKYGKELGGITHSAEEVLTGVF